MHLRAIDRQFTQMNAYFVVMNSKRCIIPVNMLYFNNFNTNAWSVQ